MRALFTGSFGLCDPHHHMTGRTQDVSKVFVLTVPCTPCKDRAVLPRDWKTYVISLCDGHVLYTGLYREQRLGPSD